MKKTKLILIGVFIAVVGFLNIGISNTKDDSYSLKSLIENGQAGGVYCNEDPGDECVVGTTDIPDYDEGCYTWFWG